MMNVRSFVSTRSSTSSSSARSSTGSSSTSSNNYTASNRLQGLRPNHHHQNQVISRASDVLRTQVHSFKRAWRRLSDSVWDQVMVSLASCCISLAPPSHASYNYRRLRRSHSSSSSAATGSSSDLALPPYNPNTINTTAFQSDCTTSTTLNSDHILNTGNTSVEYTDLLHNFSTTLTTPPSVVGAFRHELARDLQSTSPSVSVQQEDTVVLKVSILGDPETGKTSFMAKYVSAQQSEEYIETMGVEAVEKVFRVQNANIAFSIWDLGGHWECESMLPMVCRDAVAILIMFDLTKRSTLNSVKGWFRQARECNKTAMLVLIGTKYDHFVDLPQDIQYAITQQARAYAQAMGASLFFSSITHNINVHKIFKVIVAKLFDLPCNISKNLNFGEPIADY